MRVPRYSDLPNMTVRQIQELALAIQQAPPGSRLPQQLADRLAAIAIYLEDSGALRYMIDTPPDAPPQGRASNVIEFPHPINTEGL